MESGLPWRLNGLTRGRNPGQDRRRRQSRPTSENIPTGSSTGHARRSAGNLPEADRAPPIGPVERGDEVSREGVLARLDAASKSLRNAARLRREAAKELAKARTTPICSSTRPRRMPPTRTPPGEGARRTATTSGWSRKPRRGVRELAPALRSPEQIALQFRRDDARREADEGAQGRGRGATAKRSDRCWVAAPGRSAKPKRSNDRLRLISMRLARARRPSSWAVTSSSAQFRSPSAR